MFHSHDCQFSFHELCECANAHIANGKSEMDVEWNAAGGKIYIYLIKPSGRIGDEFVNELLRLLWFY